VFCAYLSSAVLERELYEDLVNDLVERTIQIDDVLLLLMFTVSSSHIEYTESSRE